MLGCAHRKENLARRNINYIPVIGNNLLNYDMHHVCLCLDEKDWRSKIQVIPSTDDGIYNFITDQKSLHESHREYPLAPAIE